ncbi:hypothetical protein [Kitasatospora sp. NPDC057198]|uniref:hypothetical protein n=1 Tax=Kitasatospora sp. NPDC057198 TaxID=3346046 RepID=UPI003645507F
MLELQQWSLRVAPGGWVRAHSPEEERTVYLQLRVTEGDEADRLNTHLALMDSEKPISVHAWSRFPFARIETLMNRDFHEVLTERVVGPEPSLDTLVEFFEAESIPVTISMVVGEQAEPAPLENPQGQITDEFLRALADVYRWHAARGGAPGPVIAEQTGAPLGTARRWINTARKRGFLPPGRPGRAG